jgi:methylglutaconyl-CoA hydratase
VPDQLVLTERLGGIVTITLDSPHNRNALSQGLLAQLRHALEDAIGDSAARLLKLTNTGATFCSGADLKEQASRFQKGGASPGAGGLVPILKLMLDSPKPILCRIDGAVRGGGMGLVAASDVVVSSELSTFGFSEVRLGVAPAVISVPVLRKLSRAAALELFLTGRVFTASEAVAYGLVNRVAGVDLDVVVEELEAELLEAAPGALGEAKRLISRVPQLDRDTAFDEMVELSARLFSSPEGQEGMAAFAERRPATWKS